MAPPSDNVPALTVESAEAAAPPSHGVVALRLAELAVLLLRASAILLLLSPALLLVALLG